MHYFLGILLGCVFTAVTYHWISLNTCCICACILFSATAICVTLDNIGKIIRDKDNKE